MSISSNGLFSKKSFTLAGVGSLSFNSFSYCSSLSNFADSSSSTSPAGALLSCVVEKADVNCVERRGTHADDFRTELERATDDCLKAAELRRVRPRGAERASVLKDIILGDLCINKVDARSGAE